MLNIISTKYLNSQKLLILSLFILLISVQSVISQEIIEKFKKVQTEEVNINRLITSIQQDKFGLIWIGTQNKLYRYDGTQFKIFERIDNDSLSLSSNYIESIFKDKNGDIWIGTNKGLDKYNYENEKFIRHGNILRQRLNVNDIRIHDMEDDSLGNLWIGISNYGLIKYNTTEKRITKVPIKDNPKENISINVIQKDKYGNLFIGTVSGLIIYNILSGHKETIYFEEESLNSIDINNIKSICLYNDKILLIGTWRGGLIKYNLITKQHILYTNTGAEGSLSDNQIESIVKDESGNVWIATWNEGLNKINTKDISENKKDLDIFKAYKNSKYDLNSLSSNTLWPLFIDNQNNLWIGTINGINLLNLHSKKFYTYNKYLKNNKPDVFSSEVNCILEDSDGNLIFGTKEGILIIDKKTKSYKRILFSKYTKSTFTDFIEDIEETYENNEHIYWFATNGGLIKYNKTKNKVKLFKNTADSNSISNDIIYDIVETDDGKFWLGTAFGLNLFDPKTEKNIRFLRDPKNINSICNNSIWSLYINKDYLYVGTSNGLSIYNAKTNMFQHFFSEKGNPTSLSNNSILSILIDMNENIWIGTFSGFNQFYQEKGLFKHFKHIPELSNSTISNIIDDKKSNLWITTEHGLAKFNYKNDSIKFYDKKDGLPSTLSYINSAYKDPEGRIYFGTIKGAFSFYPDSIQNNTFKPPVIITDIKIYNNSVEINKHYKGSVILNKSTLLTKEINLTYKHKIISFDFSALSYNNPEDNHYAYMMEGFEYEWNYSGRRNHVTYTNLPAGTYIFKVKASNNDRVWNNEYTKLKIHVTPPWWESNVFYIICICVFILSAYLFIKIRESKAKQYKIMLERTIKERTKDLYESNTQLEENQIELEVKQEEITAQRDSIEIQNEELEKHRNRLDQLVQERTAELEKAMKKAKESDHLKSAFLANMSHEIRTPMNAIVGFSSLLDDPEIGETSKQELISQIVHNSDTLLHLINDILDIAKIEANQLDINKKNYNLNDQLYKIIETFSEKKKILVNKDFELKLKLGAENSDVTIYSDPFRVQQILTNLLDNAFKFTENGFVEFGYVIKENIENPTIVFYVKDTGIGLSSEQQSEIFNRFTKFEDNKKKLYRGAGLGLAICKNISNLLGGDLGVRSESGKGSTFYFSIPYIRKADEKELIQNGSIEQLNYNWKNKSILIAEDEDGNYRFLEMSLAKTNAKLYRARNGIEAIELFQKKDLDLILMDIKMPKMDGLEATRRIRKIDEKIPIIAQTAFAMENDQKMSIEAGCNDYLSKPIRKPKLLSVIKNYIS